MTRGRRLLMWVSPRIEIIFECRTRTVVISWPTFHDNLNITTSFPDKKINSFFFFFDFLIFYKKVLLCFTDLIHWFSYFFPGYPAFLFVEHCPRGRDSSQGWRSAASAHEKDQPRSREDYFVFFACSYDLELKELYLFRRVSISPR